MPLSNMLKSKTTVLVLAVIIGFLALPVLTYAGILPDCAISKQIGKDLCNLCDIIQTGINIFRWILGILGGAALLLFVWHGFGWITSGGNKEKIEASKKALAHTVIGLAIVLGSWMIVNIVISLLTTPVGETRGIGTIFDKQAWNNWSDYCKNKK